MKRNRGRMKIQSLFPLSHSEQLECFKLSRFSVALSWTSEFLLFPRGACQEMYWRKETGSKGRTNPRESRDTTAAGEVAPVAAGTRATSELGQTFSNRTAEPSCSVQMDNTTTTTTAAAAASSAFLPAEVGLPV